MRDFFIAFLFVLMLMTVIGAIFGAVEQEAVIAGACIISFVLCMGFLGVIMTIIESQPEEEEEEEEKKPEKTLDFSYKPVVKKQTPTQITIELKRVK